MRSEYRAMCDRLIQLNPAKNDAVDHVALYLRNGSTVVLRTLTIENGLLEGVSRNNDYVVFMVPLDEIVGFKTQGNLGYSGDNENLTVADLAKHAVKSDV